VCQVGYLPQLYEDAATQSVPSWPAYRTATNTEWLYQKLYSNNCPPEDEHRVARNM